ncbi:4'-phosphopantetheinyl transferase superfamily protein [Winogradskyella sp. DF17]|uniref:4'-phosphopantetheinyl transferase superfamily protein n=1 Tax=Winogradskyella pelagia TaxID=2819984 RepID=A0ABS3T6F0_9FLAO|nr:4'-phosphopantetheinyl transferase superfamily protein [Winogradskyella sp. DF17]MBO3117879.1 4'-phosphopantetheinyl transferase superfamily protein [Winogradskyella sp. DF17]
MPLFKSISVNSQTAVKIWRIEESYDDLLKPLDLKPNSKARVLSMKSEIHQRGFLSVRHLLREFGYTDQDLYYDDYGKPHLKDGNYISITHSFEFSGVIVSNQPVGIDIEKQRPKIGRIASKFIEYETDYLKPESPTYVRDLTVIWAIKESLYKLFATPGMLFKEHFLVIPFMLEDNETVAWIDYNSKKYRHKTAFIEFEDFTCAYVVPE